MTFSFGVDQLLADADSLKTLKKARVGLLAHPASVTSGNQHTVDALVAAGVNLVRAFGPQHGMRGDVQDNMMETEDYVDPVHQLPVISLYGKHRYPTEDMLHDLDILIYDLQDLGCRIYTYITTLKYMVEACAACDTQLWVADRPNPAGRPVDGTRLEPGEESFVGCAPLPTRHGLTVGELALYFQREVASKQDVRVIKMQGYAPLAAPGYGWPLLERPWINPSPNAASLNMARCFPGTVLLEGTNLSEGRGTTMPLEVMGAPQLDARDLIDQLMQVDPDCLGGTLLRACHFIPTFHKHAGELCGAIQLHTEVTGYDHEAFKPWRLIANLLKIVRQGFGSQASLDQEAPNEGLWRHHDYEYEFGRIPIDVINGGPSLRQWVDDADAGFGEMHSQLAATEASWLKEREALLLY